MSSRMREKLYWSKTEIILIGRPGTFKWGITCPNWTARTTKPWGTTYIWLWYGDIIKKTDTQLVSIQAKHCIHYQLHSTCTAVSSCPLGIYAISYRIVWSCVHLMEVFYFIRVGSVIRRLIIIIVKAYTSLITIWMCVSRTYKSIAACRQGQIITFCWWLWCRCSIRGREVVLFITACKIWVSELFHRQSR